MSRVAAALRVLQAVGGRPDPTAPVAVGSIAQGLGITLSTTSRLCTELASLGLLARGDAYGSYRIGEAAIALSGAAAAPFAQAVRFALTLVAQQTGETAHLAARSGGEMRVIGAVDSIWTLHTPAEVSESIEDERSAALRAALASDVQEADMRLFESTLGDSVEVASPVLGPMGKSIAVVAVRFPLHRVDQAAPRARRAAVAGARRIERVLEDWLLSPNPVASRIVAEQTSAEQTPAGRTSALVATQRVLRHLAAQQDTVAGIVRATGLRADRILRILESCRTAGFVVEGSDAAHVQLAWTMHGWYRAAAAPTIVREGRRLVAETASRTQTCGFITVLKGMRSFTLVEELAMVSVGLRMVPWLGRAHPIVGSDGGPTMLMDFDPNDLPLLFPTRHTARELKVFLDRMQQVRRDGVLAMEAFDAGGMLSISAPIRDASGAVSAAACLVATTDFASAHLEEMKRETQELAARVSLLLRHPAPARADLG